MQARATGTAGHKLVSNEKLRDNKAKAMGTQRQDGIPFTATAVLTLTLALTSRGSMKHVFTTF